jgi:hypothetical protein
MVEKKLSWLSRQAKQISLMTDITNSIYIYNKLKTAETNTHYSITIFSPDLADIKLWARNLYSYSKIHTKTILESLMTISADHHVIFLILENQHPQKLKIEQLTN